MRMLMNVKFPNTEFNEVVKKGTAGRTINKIIEECRAEAVYFTEQDGHRSVLLIVNVDDPTQVPVLAEPWFLNFNASVEIRIVMSQDDLRRSGLDDLGRKWS